MSGRGNRNLSQYDRSGDASPQARSDRRFINKPASQYMPVVAGPGCWCGEVFGHDWPGKAEGVPHPRDWPGRVNGHSFR